MTVMDWCRSTDFFRRTKRISPVSVNMGFDDQNKGPVKWSRDPSKYVSKRKKFMVFGTRKRSSGLFPHTSDVKKRGIDGRVGPRTGSSERIVLDHRGHVTVPLVVSWEFLFCSFCWIWIKGSWTHSSQTCKETEWTYVWWSWSWSTIYLEVCEWEICVCVCVISG